MESKKKAIDPAPIIEKLAARCLETKGLECSVLGNVIDMLRSAPPANAVEVVRCKDCKHVEVFDTLLYCDHTRGLAGSVLPDGFCYLGERKDK